MYTTQGEYKEIEQNEPEIILHENELKLQSKIKELIHFGKTIRAHGASHSNYFDNPIYPSKNIIEMEKYTIQPRLNGNILTASAGHTLDYLRNFLKPYDLRLLATPESKFITLGGAVVVGAHNGSLLQKTMVDYVTEFLLFDANTNVHRIRDNKLFVNFGTLGIVFRISIKCFPANNIYWERILYPSIDDIVITPNTHSLVFGPYSKNVLRANIYPTNLPPTKSIGRYVWEIIPALMSTKYITKIFSNITRGLFYVFPSFGIFVSEFFLLEPSVIRDKFNYFNIAPQVNVYTQEYSVDAHLLKPVYLEIMKLIEVYYQIGTYVSYRFWVRFVAKSEVPNTLSYNRDSAVFEITYSKDQPNAQMFAKDIDLIFRKYGGKPHLGKTLISPESLSNYQFEYLKKQMEKFDPNHIFQNDFMKKSLGKF